MALTRREFLKYMATSTLGAVIFSGCSGVTRQVIERSLLFQSPASIPEDLVSGLDNYYATICQQCPAACGILVRVMEGRAKKIEGNPVYPLNDGKHCARGEASLQALYHPDRLKGPLRRTGDRGSMRFESISWDTALDDVVGHLRQLQQPGQRDTLLSVVGPLQGHKALIFDRFIKAFGGEYLAFEPQERTVVRTAIQQVFGQDRFPEFAIEQTQYLVSFGADFLGTWLSPVRYGRKYGEFRQGQPNRGIFVQVEPRLSMTGANADIWVAIRPGTEGVLALSLAQIIVSEGLADSASVSAMTSGAGAAALSAFLPESVAEVTGIAAERIRELARNFATKRPSLAIGGGPAAAQTNGLFNLQAIYALNFLVGNVGPSGSVRFNPSAPLPDLVGTIGAPFTAWQKLTERLQSGQPRPINIALIHDANPVYGLPASLNFGHALAKVPYIVSFSSFLDETTAMADIILPDHVFPEDWGDSAPDPGPGFEVLGFQQPVVRPVGDTRGFADVLLTIAEELGGDVQGALPWNTFRDALREGARSLQALSRGSVQAADFEEYWVKLLQQGGWWDEKATATAAALTPPVLPPQAKLPNFAGLDKDFPFHLVVFPSNSLLEGQLANLPWLQALPDPITTAVWQSWVEISLRTAERLGIHTGDILSVESPNGKLEAPAYVNPTTPFDIIAMPSGQGHTQYTSYAKGRGVNPLEIIAPLVDNETGALAWAATRVKVSKTGRSAQLPRFEGTVPAFQLPDNVVVPIVKE